MSLLFTSAYRFSVSDSLKCSYFLRRYRVTLNMDAALFIQASVHFYDSHTVTLSGDRIPVGVRFSAPVQTGP
jgi:hypothetical protein